LVTCDVTTEGRTVQAAACRAAVYGFDSHPRLHFESNVKTAGAEHSVPHRYDFCEMKGHLSVDHPTRAKTELRNKKPQLEEDDWSLRSEDY
jgi:hypothetical protein